VPLAGLRRNTSYINVASYTCSSPRVCNGATHFPPAPSQTRTVPDRKIQHSTHLLDESGPTLQASPTTHSDPSPQGPVSGSQIKPDILQLRRERTLDDINDMRTGRNKLRERRRRHEDGVSVLLRAYRLQRMRFADPLVS